MNYTDRIPQRPQPNNPYYNGTPKGYSVCIPGNYPKNVPDKDKTGTPGLDRLPNCSGYAVGYLNESNDRESFDLLGSYYPPYMISVAKRQGLKISEHPAQGGLMIWRKGSGKEGHVCVVKKVLSDAAVLTSESEYNGAVYAEYTRIKGDGNWRDGCYWMGNAYKYLGCIRNPAFEVENMTIDELIENMTPEQAYKLAEKARNYAGTLSASSYAAESCKKAVKAGIASDGDNDGSLDKPRAPLLRQDAMVFLNKLGLLE